MRGTWQGSGTWETSGGGGGIVLAAAAVAAAVAAAEWLLARLWWVIGGTVLVVAGTATAVLWLIRVQHRREAAHAAVRPFIAAREAPAAVSAGPRRELAGGTHIHLHFDQADTAAEAVRVIRQALPGQARDAITNQEGNPQ